MSVQQLVYEVSVRVESGKYIFDSSQGTYTGGASSIIELASPGVYNLIMDTSDYDAHPINFMVEGSTGNGGPFLTDGITITSDLSSAKTTIQVVSETLPSAVRLVCENHTGMGFQINFTEDADLLWSASEILGGTGAWIGGLENLTDAEFLHSDGSLGILDGGAILITDMVVAVRVADASRQLDQAALDSFASDIATGLGQAVKGDSGWDSVFQDFLTYLADAGINPDYIEVDLLASYSDPAAGDGYVLMDMEPTVDLNGNILDAPPAFGIRVDGVAAGSGSWNQGSVSDEFLPPVLPDNVNGDMDFMPVSVESDGASSTIVLGIWSDAQASVVSSNSTDSRQPTIQILGTDIENVKQYDPQFFELMKLAEGRVSVDGPDGFGSVVRISPESVTVLGRTKDDYKVLWLTYESSQIDGEVNVVDLIGESDVHNWRKANFQNSTLSSMEDNYASGGEIRMYVADWSSAVGTTSKVAVVIEMVTTGDDEVTVNLNQYPNPGPTVESLFRASQGFEYDDADGGFGVDEFDGLDASNAIESVRITGTAGDDQITGSDFDDQIDGGAGNDTIDGGIGADRITGGPGNDTIDGGDDGTGDYFGYGEEDHQHLYSQDQAIKGLDAAVDIANAEWVDDLGQSQYLANDISEIDLTGRSDLTFRVFAFDGVQASETQLTTIAQGFEAAFADYVSGNNDYESLKSEAVKLGLLAGNQVGSSVHSDYGSSVDSDYGLSVDSAYASSVSENSEVSNSDSTSTGGFEQYGIELLIPYTDGGTAGVIRSSLSLAESGVMIQAYQDYSGGQMDMGPDVWQVGDRAIYDDYRSAYDITTNENGDVVVTHARASNGTGDGTDTLSNIEILEFLDEQVLLAPETNTWSYDDGQSTVLEANTMGTVLDDVLDGYESDGIAANDRMEGFAGDDLLTGGLGGDSLRPGQGNDIVDGEQSGTSGEVWRDNNRLELEGAKRRYDIEEVALDGNVSTLTYVLSNGTVTSTLDATTTPLALYTVKGTGEVYRWKVAGTQNTNPSHTFDVSASFFVVSDSLTEAQGGEGVDLVSNVQEINFSDDWMTLSASTYGWFDEWSGVWHYDIQGSNFGELIDMRLYETNDVLETFDWINANDGDDVIFAGAGGDLIRGGKGSDFIDGGDNAAAAEAWPKNDEVFFEGKASRFTVEALTKDGAKLLTSVDLTSYNESDNFFSVTDTKSGDIDVLVNVEAIGFNDEYITLGVSVDGYFDQWLNSWSYNWRGTGQDDVIDVADGVDFVSDYQADSRDWMEGDQGDDVLVSGGGGDQLKGGRGHDILDGGANGIVTDPHMSWAARDEARFEGNASRFDIQKISIASIGGSGYEVVDLAGDAVYRIDSDGSIHRADGIVFEADVAYTAVSGASVFVISDTLLASYGGQGVDILVDIEGLSFSDEFVDLDIRIDAQEWNNGAWVEGTKFDDLINIKDGVAYDVMLPGGGTQTQYFQNSDIDPGAGDDIVITGDGADRVRSSLGDDYLDLGASGVIDPDNPWDTWSVFDRVQYDGAFERYTVTEGFTVRDITTLMPILESGSYQFAEATGDLKVGLGQEHVEAIEISDRLSEAAGGDGTDIIVGADELSFQDAWIELAVRQNAWTNTHYSGNTEVAYTEVEVRGTFKSEIVEADPNSLGDYSAGYQTYHADRLRGEGGNDILIGGKGGDEFEGGLGDDVLLGGSITQDADLVGTVSDSWIASDKARYYGPVERFDVSRKYVDLGTDLDALLSTLKTGGIGEQGGVVLHDDEGAGLTEVFVVSDTLSDDQGGLGTDILFGVEQIEFNTNNTYARIDTRPTFELLNWDKYWWSDDYYDNRSDQGIWVEGTIFDDKLDIADGFDLPGASGFFRADVRASQGNDTYYGSTASYERLEYQAARDEFVLTVFEDADGDTAVRVDHLLAGGVVGAYGTDILYDIDSINFSVGNTPDVRLQNLFEWEPGKDFNSSRAADNGGRFRIETSIYDDVLDLSSGNYVIDQQFQSLRSISLDDDGNRVVSDAEATIDASSIDVAPQLDFIASSGDDVLIGGANFDRVRYGLLEDEITIAPKFYILDSAQDLSVGYATRTEAKAAANTANGDQVLSGFEVSGVSSSGVDYGTDTLFNIESIKYELTNGDEEYIYLAPVQRAGEDYIQGTRFDDYIDSTMAGQFGFVFDDTDPDLVRNIELFGGDDYIDLSDVKGDQRVFGGAGDDFIDFGLADRTDAGNGTDEARFYGSVDNFTITFHEANGDPSDVYLPDGYVKVIDNVGDEGTDIIYGAERLRFDGYYTIVSLEGYPSLADSWFFNGANVNFDGADETAVEYDSDGLVVSSKATDYTATYGTRQTTYVSSGVVVDMSNDANLSIYEDYSKALWAIETLHKSDINDERFVYVNNRTGQDAFDGYNIRGTTEADVLTGSQRIDRFYGDGGNDVYIGNGTKGVQVGNTYLSDSWNDADEVAYQGKPADRFTVEYVEELSAEQLALFAHDFATTYAGLEPEGFLVTDTVTGDVDFLSGIDRLRFDEWSTSWLTVREEVWSGGERALIGTDRDDRIVSEVANQAQEHRFRPGGGDDVVIGPNVFGEMSISDILATSRDALYDLYSEVEYNGKASDFVITSLTDQDANGDNIWDATGLTYNPVSARDYRTDGPADPPEYFIVEDTRAGWNGSDVIFGVERIRFSVGDDSERFDLVPFFEFDGSTTLRIRDGIAGYDYTSAVAAAVPDQSSLTSVRYDANLGDDTYVGLGDDSLYQYVWDGDTVRFAGRESDFSVSVLPNDDDGNRVVRVTDLRDGGYGVNTLINIETIRFEDPTSNSNDDIVLVPDLRDWDGDDNIDRFEGTQFGDILIGDAGRNDIIGGAGNDNLVGGPSGDWIRPGSGHDFVDGSVSQVSGDEYLNDWETRNEVNFEAPSDRVTITSVYVGLDGDGFAIRNADGSFKTFASATEVTDGTATMAYYVVDDLPVDADGSIGTNILINVDAIGFDDDWFELSGRREERDWDGDGVIDEVFSEGTPFDDEIEGSTGNDYMNAREGDDHLTGLGGGDNLRGGLGNDVIDGGANGNTGDPWRDLDTAEYNGIEGRYEISDALIDVDVDEDGVWDNTLRAYEDGATAPIYYTVTDSLTEDLGGTGIDVLVGIERIRFRESEIDLGLRVYTQDWDEDGQVDWSEIRGTNNSDSIVDGAGGLDLANDDEIRGRDGDDIIVAGAGGDRISGGAGDDFIDGGDNGTPYGFDGERLEPGYAPDEISWEPKDEVRFDGSRDRFEIYDSSDLSALTTLGLTKTDGDGNVTIDLSSYLDGTGIETPTTFKVIKDTLPDTAGGFGIDIVTNVEFIAFSDDFIALQAETYVNYDADGNEIGRSVNGTLSSETLLGGSGDDNVWGKDGDDVLRGKAGGDWLEGGAGNDTIYGGKNGFDDWGNERYDTAVFSGDYSEYEITTEDRTVDGIDVVAVIVADSDEGRDGTDTLFGVEQLQFSDQWIQVTVTQESMFDYEGNETGLYVRGSILADTLTGDSFGDILEGGAGNDTMNGGGGADRIYGGQGNDTIDGGANGLDPWGNPGQDVAVYEGVSSRYTINHFDADGEISDIGFDPDGYVQIVDSVLASAGGEGTDRLVGIERIEFSDKSVSFQSLNVFVDLDGDGFPDQGQVFGTTGDDVLNGSEFDERLIGDAGDDVLYGGAGGDRFDGGSGNDVLVGGLDGAPDATGRRRPDIAEIDASVSDATIANGFVLQKDDGSLVTNTEASGFSGLNTNTANFGAAVFDAKTHDISGTSYKWSNDGAAKILSYTDADGDLQADVLFGIEIIEFNDAVVSTAIKTNRMDFDRDGAIDEIVVNGTLGADTIDQSGATVGVVIDAGPGDDTVSTGSGDDQIRLGTGTDSVTDASSSDFDILILQGDQLDWLENSGVWTHNDYGQKTVVGIELIQFDDGARFLSNQVAEIDYDDDGNLDEIFVKLAAGSSYEVDLTDSSVAGLSHTLVGADLSGSEADVLIGGNGSDVLIGGAGANTLLGGDNISSDGTSGSDVAVFDGTHIDVTDDSNTTTEADYEIAAKYFVVASDGSVGEAYDSQTLAEAAKGSGSVAAGFTVTDGLGSVNKLIGIETLQFTDGILDLAPSIDIDKVVKPTGVVESYTVRGTQFADTITGQAGADDVLIGGGSLDQFVFGDDSGFDQILDFTVTGTDTDDDGTNDSFETIKILIDGSTGLNGNTNIGDVDDVLNLVNSSLDGALIDLGNNNQILVIGVDADDLTSSHFEIA